MAQPAQDPAPAAATPKVIPAPAQAQAQIRVQTPAQPQAKATEKINFVQGAQHAGAAPAKPVEAPKAAARPLDKPIEKPADKLAAKPAEAPVKQVAEVAPKQGEKPVAATKPQQVAKLETGATPTQTAVPAAAQAAAEPESDKPEFRWPARGRIIQGFKAGTNDGINIAVPEGTAVKAAEAGVVAYAGNELKGYGNLVLIRHPNGFVSAYANNGEISVKRGETVKRGQAIAKSGQTGNVSSPQLHFELRKGSTPVDPTEFLAGL
jgi:murein DD-endopeptidase MepM/ murein hydrolase activator NlpD